MFTIYLGGSKKSRMHLVLDERYGVFLLPNLKSVEVARFMWLDTIK